MKFTKIATALALTIAAAATAPAMAAQEESDVLKFIRDANYTCGITTQSKTGFLILANENPDPLGALEFQVNNDHPQAGNDIRVSYNLKNYWNPQGVNPATFDLFVAKKSEFNAGISPDSTGVMPSSHDGSFAYLKNRIEIGTPYLIQPRTSLTDGSWTPKNRLTVDVKLRVNC